MVTLNCTGKINFLQHFYFSYTTRNGGMYYISTTTISYCLYLYLFDFVIYSVFIMYIMYHKCESLYLCRYVCLLLLHAITTEPIAIKLGIGSWSPEITHYAFVVVHSLSRSRTYARKREGCNQFEILCSILKATLCNQCFVYY